MRKLAPMVTLAVLATISGATTADVSINETVFTIHLTESDEMSPPPPVTELREYFVTDPLFNVYTPWSSGSMSGKKGYGLKKATTADVSINETVFTTQTQ
jgi:hypothetical protein